MYRRPANGNRIYLLVLINIVLAAALLVALVVTLIGKTKDAPEIVIDGDTVMRYADHFGVSIEFLQIILPNYFVYTEAGKYRFQKIDPKIALHKYDLTLLDYTEDGQIYYEDAAYPDVCYGVDVSTFQHEIDWPAVAADGVDFAMIRVGYRGYTEGTLFMDDYFTANIEGALAAGLEVGVYFFSQAVTEAEAEEEADLLLNAIADYHVTYPVVFDMEEISGETSRTDNLDADSITAITKAFCKKIKKAGYTPMIYGNTKWLASRIDLRELKAYPVWFAQYYTKPLYPYDFDMWQYTNGGTVAGIDGEVDLNICFKKF